MLEAFNQRFAQSEPTKPTTLVIGAVGRLGEAVLNQVLACEKYSHVYILGEGALNSTMRGVSLAGPQSLAQIDSVYLVLSDSDDKGQRSYYGRDSRFTALTLENILPLAKTASASGARRALLLAPTPAWQQLSRFQQGLMNANESAIAALSFETLVVLRPVAQSKTVSGNLLQRFASFYLDLQMMMLPRSVPVLTSDQLGRASVLAMAQAKDGLSVLQAQEIANLLK